MPPGKRYAAAAATPMEPPASIPQPPPRPKSPSKRSSSPPHASSEPPAKTRRTEPPTKAELNAKPRSDSAAVKPTSRKRFLRFLKAHELRFALEPVARDERTGEVTLVLCRFCQLLGREQRPGKQRRASKNVKYFRNSFRTDQYQQHHELSHPETWKRYQACTDEEKRLFFTASRSPQSSSSTGEDAESTILDKKLEVELAPGEVWTREPTLEERRRCFEVSPAVVELVALLAIGATQPTVASVVEKQSHHIMNHAHEPVSSHAVSWNPPKETFQSCELVGSSTEATHTPVFRVVTHSCSQMDCLVALTAAGLSFRQTSQAISAFRSHASALLGDLTHTGSGSSERSTKKQLAKKSSEQPTPEYNQEQTAEFVRLVIACSMQTASRLLRGCWAFSLELCAATQHAPVRSFLDVRVKVYGAGALHNLHLLAFPCFESTCKMMMFQTLDRVLSAVLPDWRRRLLGVSIDGEAQATKSVTTLVERLEEVALNRVMNRSSNGCHRLERILTNFYASLQGGCFLPTLQELGAYVRRQPALLQRLQEAPPNLNNANNSLLDKWTMLGRETNWIATHRELLRQHLKDKKPSSAPDSSWWLFLVVVDWVASRANKAFAQLQRKRTTAADKAAAVATLAKECAAAFHAQGPLDEQTPTPSAPQDTRFTSRGGRFSLSKMRMLAFTKETSTAAIQLTDCMHAVEVELVMENLCICGVNMLESLLELSTRLGDTPASSGTTTVELVPPTLPHELAEFSGGELAALVRVYGAAVRNFLSEEDIDALDQEHQDLRRETTRETALKAALSQCDEETPFETAWALTERRFKHLEAFAGGFASVFPCDPIPVQGDTGDLPLCVSKMDTARVLLADFALEGALHAQQFPALMTLNDKLDELATVQRELEYRLL